ncbi:hypothetical protein KFU94_50350 [Chloroflexi bacterium TSY]|nr:hypothetical protein [Chloroflexi bacterium TSY]
MDTANRTYSIYVIQDPAYNTPLVLATVMTLQPETIYLVYLERWPVEPPPPLGFQADDWLTSSICSCR